MSDSKKPLGSAFLMGIATLASRFLGLLREQVFAYYFGAGNLTDAFQVAFRIPNLLRDLFAEGAMSSALVPIFIQVKAERGERRSWVFAYRFFYVITCICFVLSIVGIVFSKPLVELYASSFHQIENKFENTVLLTQIMFPFLPMVSLAAAFMAVLNACGFFFLPSLAPAISNVVAIILGIFFSQIVFSFFKIEPIAGMSVGIVAGGVVQAFFQLPLLLKLGLSQIPLKALLDPQELPFWKDPKLRKILSLMLPGTLGLAATQINLLINTILATSEQPGAVSWLYYAFRILQFPIGIFGVSLAQAYLPQIAKSHTQESRDLTQLINSGIKMTWGISLFATVGLFFLAQPILALVYQYGKFTPMDTQSTARALQMYCLGLPAFCVIKMITPIFYTLGNTWIPLSASFLSVIVTLVFNLSCVRWLSYPGLALGTSIAAWVGTFYLSGFLKKILKQKGWIWSWTDLKAPLIQLSLASVTMGCVLMVFLPWAEFRSPKLIFRLFNVLSGIGVGCLTLWIFGFVFKVDEILELFDLFLRKLKKKL